MNVRRGICLVLSVLGMAACAHRQPTSAVEAVTLTRIPADGYADVTVYMDGRMRGGHTSGGPQAFVHEENQLVSPSQVAPIGALAEKVYRSPVASQPVITQRERVVIRITTTTGLEKIYQRQEQTPFADGKLRQLERLLQEQRIGGW